MGMELKEAIQAVDREAVLAELHETRATLAAKLEDLDCAILILGRIYNLSMKDPVPVKRITAACPPDESPKDLEDHTPGKPQQRKSVPNGKLSLTDLVWQALSSGERETEAITLWVQSHGQPQWKKHQVVSRLHYMKAMGMCSRLPNLSWFPKQAPAWSQAAPSQS
jgi:hypothetical protein